MAEENPFSTSLQSFWYVHSGKFTKSIVTLATVGLQQLFTGVVFRWPCQDEKHKSLDNYSYGLVFLLVPASILLIMGVAFNRSTWKLLTGCCFRQKGPVTCCEGLKTTGEVVMASLIAPITWICVALLEGKYYACALTANPYNATQCNHIYGQISQGEDKFSVEYHDNVARSQFYGWLVGGVAFLLGILIYSVYRCCSREVYWQREFSRLTRKAGEAQFQDTSEKHIRKKATDKIEKFLGQTPTNADWEKVKEFYEMEVCLQPEPGNQPGGISASSEKDQGGPGEGGGA